jgi:hypothetical protein
MVVVGQTKVFPSQSIPPGNHEKKRHAESVCFLAGAAVNHNKTLPSSPPLLLTGHDGPTPIHALEFLTKRNLRLTFVCHGVFPNSDSDCVAVSTHHEICLAQKYATWVAEHEQWRFLRPLSLICLDCLLLA